MRAHFYKHLYLPIYRLLYPSANCEYKMALPFTNELNDLKNFVQRKINVIFFCFFTILLKFSENAIALNNIAGLLGSIQHRIDAIEARLNNIYAGASAAPHRLNVLENRLNSLQANSNARGRPCGRRGSVNFNRCSLVNSKIITLTFI